MAPARGAKVCTSVVASLCKCSSCTAENTKSVMGDKIWTVWQPSHVAWASKDTCPEVYSWIGYARIHVLEGGGLWGSGHMPGLISEAYGLAQLVLPSTVVVCS